MDQCKKTPIVSIDFDGTLQLIPVQNYARELLKRGVDVHIVTRRYDNPFTYTPAEIAEYGIDDVFKEWDYLFEVAKSLGIKNENIHFLNMTPKSMFFKDNEQFLWHLDDIESETYAINHFTKTIGISVYESYREKGNDLINQQ